MIRVRHGVDAYKDRFDGTKWDSGSRKSIIGERVLCGALPHRKMGICEREFSCANMSDGFPRLNESESDREWRRLHLAIQNIRTLRER